MPLGGPGARLEIWRGDREGLQRARPRGLFSRPDEGMAGVYLLLLLRPLLLLLVFQVLLQHIGMFSSLNPPPSAPKKST